MSKRTTRLIALTSLLMALTLTLSGCNLVVKDPEVDAKQVIVSVNGETIDKQAFAVIYQNALNQEYYMQQLYQQYGLVQSISVDEARVQQDALDGAVLDLVLHQKAKGLELDVLTEEETAALDTQADADLKGYLDQVRERDFAGTELTGEALDKAVAEKALEYGYTKEAVLKQLQENKLHEKLREYATRDVKVTDEAIQAEYDKKVEEAKASYETNASLYGQNVNNGETVYFTPAGYRFVKQILIKFTKEDQDAITTLENELEPLKTALDAAQAEADKNAAAAAAEGVSEEEKKTLAETAETLQKTLAEAQSAYDAKAQELTSRKETAYAAILPKADEVYGMAAAQGADFDALAAEFNEDTGMPKAGYAVTEGFSGFDEAFVKPAMALQNVGDVAEPSGGIYGYYITRYAADITPGAVPLETVRQGILDGLLKTAQDTAYSEAEAGWKAAAKVETYPQRLKD